MPNYMPYPNVYPQMQIPMQTQPQIQNGGFVSVRNENEARNYPIAPGNSITFKDETAPYVYTKTMGFSKLDRPIFEKFKLVKEDAIETPESSQNESFNIEPINTSINELKDQIDMLWNEIEGLKNDNKSETSAKRTPKRKDDGDD